jgi:hypothetical protein
MKSRNIFSLGKKRQDSSSLIGEIGKERMLPREVLNG